MHVRLLALVTCICFCIHSVNGNGNFENCCLSYAKMINPTGFYKHVKYYKQQEVSESCNMRAVVFYLKRRNRVICANPQEKWVHILMKHVDTVREQYSKARQDG
ncbi:hypothetical protein FKM82_014807 [Ascaphus truei]|uniref:C-C motif chemokine 25 n=1 Tax=Ascaphus truei TaxID=8439 RepID=UPI003F5987E6